MTKVFNEHMVRSVGHLDGEQGVADLRARLGPAE